MWENQQAKRKAEKFKFICHDRPEYMIFIAFFIISFMCFSNYSPIINYQTSIVFPYFFKIRSTTKSCSGHYIYMHDLPPKFNLQLLENCTSLNKWYNVCPYIQNSGFGPKIVENGEDQILGQKGSWFSTDQFFLEVIFHNRMKRYECLTTNSSLASAIYVPFYSGFDIGRHLWGYNITVRDALSVDLLKWLTEKPEWTKFSGKDHFFVGGRIAWDYRRARDNDTEWGGKLMHFPESENLTMLTIESTFWSNEIAIPYPTYFHPMTRDEVIEWQSKMKTQKRRYLASFVGAPRPGREDLVRGEIFSQCLAMGKSCNLLNCNSKGNDCHDPVQVMKVFEDSVFCLQPPGDSLTRRSAFDSIIAGCIPVFFHPGSAYTQYIWHLPKKYSDYSVLIPENLVKNGSLSIKETLMKISGEKRRAMREEVVRLIPKVVYVNPLMDRGEMEDAFDIAIKGIIERVEKAKNNSSISLEKYGSWKKKLSSLGQEQWNSFF